MLFDEIEKAHSDVSNVLLQVLDDGRLDKLLADRKITIELTSAARKAIFKAGYDRAYGARPLKRAIQRLVQDPLATKILDGTVRHSDHVVVDAGNAGLTFNVTEAADATR
jgi:ATP-dependent Clp protease ATP-binding subunit ClpB